MLNYNNIFWECFFYAYINKFSIMILYYVYINTLLVWNENLAQLQCSGDFRKIANIIACALE